MKSLHAITPAGAMYFGELILAVEAWGCVNYAPDDADETEIEQVDPDDYTDDMVDMFSVYYRVQRATFAELELYDDFTTSATARVCAERLATQHGVPFVNQLPRARN